MVVVEYALPSDPLLTPVLSEVFWQKPKAFVA